MSDSDSDRITAQQLWNDVAAILINPTILTEDMEYQVPEQNYTVAPKSNSKKDLVRVSLV